MRKIFYRPDTLEIIGMSEGEDSMNFPYVTTEEDLHSTLGCKINENKELVIEKKELELDEDGNIIL